MPDLFKMKRDDAVAALERSGYRGSIVWDDQLCGTLEQGQLVETGEVCRQRPASAQVVSVRQSVSILVQREDPRHGNVGAFGEWHLMPEVVGMSLDEAQSAMHAAGFTDDRTRVEVADEPG
ncbi:MAG: PASTA domain-containing protein, partial [Rhodoglobus sp.]